MITDYMGGSDQIITEVVLYLPRDHLPPHISCHLPPYVLVHLPPHILVHLPSGHLPPPKFNGLRRVAVFLDMVVDEKVDKVVDGVADMVWDMSVDKMTSVVVNGCGG